MAYLYYTVTAILLYLFSDWIVNKIESYYGKRFQYRTVLFFVIIFTLSVSLFEMIDRIVGEPPQLAPSTEEISSKEVPATDDAQITPP